LAHQTFSQLSTVHYYLAESAGNTPFSFFAPSSRFFYSTFYCTSTSFAAATAVATDLNTLLLTCLAHQAFYFTSTFEASLLQLLLQCCNSAFVGTSDFLLHMILLFRFCLFYERVQRAARALFSHVSPLHHFTLLPPP
jgi:hypothetical protein